MEASPGTHRVLITTLAFNQTRFFVGVAHHLRKRGFEPVFVCLHDRSIPFVENEGFMAYRIYDHFPSHQDLEKDADAIEERYGLDLHRLCAHERYFHGETDSHRLLTKAVEFFRAYEKIFNKLEESDDSPITVVQELGGVLGLQVCFYVARDRGYDNWFIEPALFQGRVIILKNKLGSQRPLHEGLEASKPEQQVIDYLAETIDQQRINIPSKDRWKHDHVMRILVRPERMKRLTEKLLDKYLFGYREEFDYIGNYVLQHIRMLKNRVVLGRYYRRPLEGRRRIYFPLHVPADMALTIRSPEFLDQCSLLDYLARVIPRDCQLITKEHPAMVGGADAPRLSQLLRTHDNLVLLDPRTNNFDILRSCDVVVTINSKSGAEALFLGKSVIVLGDAFYRDSPLVKAVEHLGRLTSAIEKALCENDRASDDPMILAYMQRVWDDTYEGELYSCDPENIAMMGDSISTLLAGSLSRRSPSRDI